MAGRNHPTLEDEKVMQLLSALTAGHYMERAAALAQIGQSTVYQWLERGRAAAELLEQGETLDKKDQAYYDITQAIQKAKHIASHRAMQAIQTAATAGNWQAAAWYLERTDRSHYGRWTQVTGPDEGPIRVKVDRDELTAEILRLLEGPEDDNT